MTITEPVKSMLKKLCIVIIFSIALAYIEAAVVVYLRTIFHPEGFRLPLTTFGLTSHWRQLVLTEIGREAATIVLITTAAVLFGRNRREKAAYFLTTFAVWDIFYYIWLKVLINWPTSIMDWDILFLIPVAWASPVLYPVLVSAAMFAFALMILYQSALNQTIKITTLDLIGLSAATALVTTSFCIGGLHITQPDFQNHFSWPVFACGYTLAIVLFLRCLLRPASFSDLRAE